MNIPDNMLQFYGLTESEIETTMNSFTPLNIPAKQFFLKEGNVSEKIGYVKKGIFRSYFYNQEGEEITTNFYPSGSLIISFESFNNQVPSEENIVAVEDSELMVISYQKQQELYNLVPAWQNICRDFADKKSQDMMERSVQFQTLSAAERYQQFCKQYPEVIQKCALIHIASYLGIDNATLSRIRKRV